LLSLPPLQRRNVFAHGGEATRLAENKFPACRGVRV
jgi:hypothetical protein